MDITPKPMLQSPTVVLNYDSKKTPGDLYQIVLKTLDDQIIALGDDKNKLSIIRNKLVELTAMVDNRIYKLSHPDTINSPLKRYEREDKL